MASRHESLVPLSRDHYHGLLLAQQIRTTDRVMLVGWPDAPAKQAAFIVEFYREHLVPHFQAEEESLFPLVRQHVPEGTDQIDDLLNEHRLIRAFVEEFRSPDASSVKGRIAEFAELLDGHIRKEERGLFPLFEARAPAAVLAQAGHLLHRSDPEGSSGHP